AQCPLDVKSWLQPSVELFSGRGVNQLGKGAASVSNNTELLGNLRAWPASEQAAHGRTEREMSTDELVHPRVSGTARRACAASAPQRAEERVGQQEQRLAATYHHAGIGIVEVDAQGKFARVNAQWCALTGYAPDEMLGRSIFERTDEDEDVKA